MKLEQTAPLDQDLERAHEDHEHDEMADKIKRAKNLGFTGDICSNCGSMNVKKNGSCNVCTDCGTTTGCS
jgi:membrane protease subunit (stomatin/prohibitin family)